MEQRRRRGGRPYKGDRVLCQVSELPAPVVDQVLARAAEHALAMGDYLAVVIARAHAIDMPWPQASPHLYTTVRTHRDHPRLSTRIPRQAVDLVAEEASARGMARAAYLAVVVARAHGLELQLPARYPVDRPEEALLGA